jgi:hypothetical protein
MAKAWKNGCTECLLNRKKPTALGQREIISCKHFAFAASKIYKTLIFFGLYITTLYVHTLIAYCELGLAAEKAVYIFS